MPRTRFEPSTVDTTESGKAAVAAAAPFTLPPYKAASPIISPTTTAIEAEQHLAVYVKDPLALLGAVSDFSSASGVNRTKVVGSTDGGLTWKEQFMPANASGLLTTADGRAWEANSDPVCAISADGYAYVANLYFNGVKDPNDQSNGIYVWATNHKAPITADQIHPVQIWTDPATPYFGDKEWIATDNTVGKATSGNVYVSWTRFYNNDNAIRISHSSDHGVTWSAPERLNPADQVGHVQGSQVDVGPDGTVYVSWELTLVSGSRQIWFIRRLPTENGWRLAHPVTPVYNTLNFGPSYRTNSFGKFRVDPIQGNIHMAWPAQDSFSAGPQMNYSMSTDGGVTFSTRVKVSDSPKTTAFMPMIAVDNNSVVHMAWYDTRNSPNNNPQFYDVYAAYSSIPGQWSKNFRVTDTIIDAGVGDQFIGDYSGMRALGHDHGTTPLPAQVHPFWTSGGFNGGKLQTRILTLP